MERAQAVRTAQFALELNKERGAWRRYKSGRQALLERGIDEAWVAAHRSALEEVTTAADGEDRVYRIKTPYGVNICLSWRDVARLATGSPKGLFVMACNR